MPKRTREAARKARYREKLRQQTVPADFEAQVERIRALVRSDTPEDMVRRYVGLASEFERELAGRNRARVLRDLNDALATAARELGLSPRERRLEGRDDEMVPASAALRSLRNIVRIKRTRWEHLKLEIALFGAKEDLGGQTRTDLIGEIETLRARAPDLFDPAELAATPEALYDRIVAAGLPRLDEPPPLH